MSNVELLLAAPLRLEAILIRSAIGRARVCRTGMGPRRASEAAHWLLEEPGDVLLVMGFCGGLDEASEPGEVVVAEEVSLPENPTEGTIKCSVAPSLVGLLRRRGLRVRQGTIASISRIAVGERRRELREGGAIVVDMESAWLAAGAGGRPFGVVRVVVDTPTRELVRPLLTLGGIARGATSLRRVAAALHDWAPGD